MTAKKYHGSELGLTAPTCAHCGATDPATDGIVHTCRKCGNRTRVDGHAMAEGEFAGVTYEPDGYVVFTDTPETPSTETTSFQGYSTR